MTKLTRFTLDAALPSVLPAEVTKRFPTAPKITVRMLLDHRSGLPECDTPAVDVAVVRRLDEVRKVSDFLDLAAAQKPLFAPGTRYKYSNIDYALLGLIIEHDTDRNWRQEVTDGVIKPLGLKATVLPAPGNRSAIGPYAHGYVAANGKVLDVSDVDPSFAGPAGGNALVTTVRDLVRFLDALLAGRLFRHRETLRQMLTFAPAPDVGGRSATASGSNGAWVPGDVETIGHLDGAVGYVAYVGRLPRQKATVAVATNSSADPSLLLLPVCRVFAGARR